VGSSLLGGKTAKRGASEKIARKKKGFEGALTGRYEQAGADAGGGEGSSQACFSCCRGEKGEKTKAGKIPEGVQLAVPGPSKMAGKRVTG